MTRHRVEDTLDRIIRERLLDADLLKAAVRAHNNRGTLPAPDPGAIDRHRKDLEARRARVLEAFFGGLITRQACDEQVRAVDAQLAAVPKAEPQRKRPTIDPKAVTTIVRTLARWGALSWEARREILEALAPVFVVHRYNVEGVRLDVPTGSGSRTATPEDTRLFIPLAGVA